MGYIKKHRSHKNSLKDNMLGLLNRTDTVVDRGQHHQHTQRKSKELPKQSHIHMTQMPYMRALEFVPATFSPLISRKTA